MKFTFCAVVLPFILFAVWFAITGEKPTSNGAGIVGYPLALWLCFGVPVCFVYWIARIVGRGVRDSGAQIVYKPTAGQTPVAEPVKRVSGGFLGITEPPK